MNLAEAEAALGKRMRAMAYAEGHRPADPGGSGGKAKGLRKTRADARKRKVLHFFQAHSPAYSCWETAKVVGMDRDKFFWAVRKLHDEGELRRLSRDRVDDRRVLWLYEAVE